MGHSRGLCNAAASRPAGLVRNPNRAIPVTHLFGDMVSRVPAEEARPSELGTEGVGKPAPPPRGGHSDGRGGVGAIVHTEDVSGSFSLKFVLEITKSNLKKIETGNI